LDYFARNCIQTENRTGMLDVITDVHYRGIGWAVLGIGLIFCVHFDDTQRLEKTRHNLVRNR